MQFWGPSYVLISPAHRDSYLTCNYYWSTSGPNMLGGSSGEEVR